MLNLLDELEEQKRKAAEAARKAAQVAREQAEKAGKIAADTKREAEKAARQATADAMEKAFPPGFKENVQKNKKFMYDLIGVIKEVNPSQAVLEEVSKITENQWQLITEKWRAEVSSDPTLLNEQGRPSKKGLKVVETIVIGVGSAIAIHGSVCLLIGGILCAFPPTVPFGILFLVIGTIEIILAIGIETFAGITLVWVE